MRVRFIGSGEPGENAVCVVFGTSFPVGQWVPVSAEIYKRLSGNWTFERDQDDDGQADPTLEQMRKALDDRGIPYHHRAGLAKLKALLDGDL